MSRLSQPAVSRVIEGRPHVTDGNRHDAPGGGLPVARPPHAARVCVARRGVGLFGDVGDTGGFALGNGFCRHDVVPGPAVLSMPPGPG
jgi:hypothetical protein